MRIKLNLSQQVQILVGVPVGLMLAFLICLLGLFLKVEHEAKENEHSKTVISTANLLVKQYYDAASRLIIYKHTKTDEARQDFQTQLSGTEDSFKRLRAMVKNDKEEVTLLLQLRSAAAEGMALMKRYENYIAGGEQLNALQVAVLYKQFDDCGAEFTSKLNELSAHETAKHKVNSKHEELTRSLILLWIFVGVIASVGLGVFMRRWFARDVTSKLAQMVENTRRLSRKEQLYPVLPGDDELARLDLFFHKMADDLAEAARKERAIVDNVLDVICSIDGEGRFISVNPASLQVWGYHSEKLKGEQIAEILVKEDREKFSQSLAQIQTSGEMVHLENGVLSEEGNVVHTLWSLRWSQAEESFFCVAHDISDRKEVERVKQEFVAVISHELRTPLTSLQMTLSLLLDGTYGPLSGTAQKRVRNAEFGIGRLISLINDLLDIEKMEAGKLTMNYAEVDIADIVERSIDTVQGFAEQQGVTLYPQMRSAKLTADSDRVIQVLVNLLSNAVKFSEDGGAVEIVTLQVDGFWEVRVVDHGAGVPPGCEESIFAKYGQAHTDRSKRRRGTGLGLPICKAIVEQHGGSIGVCATEKGGSTFWFRLPGQLAELPDADADDDETHVVVQPGRSMLSRV